MASGGRSDSGASRSGGKTKRGNGRVSGAKRGAVNTKAKVRRAVSKGAKSRAKKLSLEAANKKFLGTPKAGIMPGSKAAGLAIDKMFGRS